MTFESFIFSVSFVAQTIFVPPRRAVCERNLEHPYGWRHHHRQPWLPHLLRNSEMNIRWLPTSDGQLGNETDAKLLIYPNFIFLTSALFYAFWGKERGNFSHNFAFYFIFKINFVAIIIKNISTQ